MKTVRITALFLMFALAVPLLADETWTQNNRANRLYKKGQYEQALKIYDDAILEAPDDSKLKMNKGSTLYKLGQFDKAEEAYNSTKELKNKKAQADLFYNRGNTLYREGQQMLGSGGQGASGAQEKLKSALENYIKALDLKPSDKDAKWNLQLTQNLIKQAQQQQQQSQDNKDQKNDKQDKNQQNQDNKQDNKNQQNKDQDSQDKQDQQDKQNQQDQKKDDQQQKQQENQGEKKDEQQKPPQPAQGSKEEQMKKDEAMRLIQQFSDDANNLNKPVKMYKAIEKKPEKDW